MAGGKAGVFRGPGSKNGGSPVIPFGTRGSLSALGRPHPPLEFQNGPTRQLEGLSPPFPRFLPGPTLSRDVGDREGPLPSNQQSDRQPHSSAEGRCGERRNRAG